METKIFEKFSGEAITDDILQAAATLFSDNYGVWGGQAARFCGAFAKHGMALKCIKNASPELILSIGRRVKMSKERLRAQSLPAGGHCSYVRVTIDERLAGHAFACRWKYGEKTVCWITQLVVDRRYRERGLAFALLNDLREDSDHVYGIMSSQPAACLAAAKALGSKSTYPDHIRISFWCMLIDASALHLPCLNSVSATGPLTWVNTHLKSGADLNRRHRGRLSGLHSGARAEHHAGQPCRLRQERQAAWPFVRPGRGWDGLWRRYKFLRGPHRAPPDSRLHPRVSALALGQAARRARISPPC